MSKQRYEPLSAGDGLPALMRQTKKVGENAMDLEKYLYEARLLIIRLAKLMTDAASDEQIKKEPQIQQIIVSTAKGLLIEAETLEKELRKLNLRSDNSISE